MALTNTSFDWSIFTSGVVDGKDVAAFLLGGFVLWVLWVIATSDDPDEKHPYRDLDRHGSRGRHGRRRNRRRY